jgi:hypothetical protein
MTEKRTWKEFRNAGLLWWINTQLHLFGWALVFEFDENQNIIEVYPARVKFRGFGEKQNTEGYQKVSQYLKDNIDEIKAEAEAKNSAESNYAKNQFGERLDGMSADDATKEYSKASNDLRLEIHLWFS